MIAKKHKNFQENEIELQKRFFIREQQQTETPQAYGGVLKAERAHYFTDVKLDEKVAVSHNFRNIADAIASIRLTWGAKEPKLWEVANYRSFRLTLEHKKYLFVRNSRKTRTCETKTFHLV